MPEYEHDYDKIHRELMALSDKVQNGELADDVSNREFREAISSLKKNYLELHEDSLEIKKIVSSVDREQAIQTEKNTNIFYQLGQLEKRIEELEKSKDQSSEKTRELIEKIFMLIIGGLVTYVFSKFS